jgi:hypothetical protein
MSQIIQNTNQYTILRSAIVDLSNRINKIENSRNTATSDPIDHSIKISEIKLDFEKYIKMQFDTITIDLKSELRNSITKEKNNIETTLNHKCESMIAKIIKERTEQLQKSMTSEIDQINLNMASLLTHQTESEKTAGIQLSMSDAGSVAVDFDESPPKSQKTRQKKSANAFVSSEVDATA